MGGLPLVPALAQECRLPPGSGRDAVIAGCSDCHGLVALFGKHLSYRAWYSIVGRMVNNGASITAQDRQAIDGYLAEHFGPKDAASDASPAAK